MSTTNTKGEERPFVKHELQINNVTLKAKHCPVLLKCVTSSDKGTVVLAGGEGGMQGGKES